MQRTFLMRIVLAGGILAVGSLSLSPRVWADDTAQLKQQVRNLQERVNQLEARMASAQQAPVATPVLDQWQWEDPFEQMMQMRQQMNNEMRRTFGATGMYTPRTDIRQTDKKYIITMDLPGMDKSKINVRTKNGMLVISGERRSETTNNGKQINNQYYTQERAFGSFLQAIPLPKDAVQNHIDATYVNGVLTVTIDRSKKKAQEEQKIIVR